MTQNDGGQLTTSILELDLCPDCALVVDADHWPEDATRHQAVKEGLDNWRKEGYRLALDADPEAGPHFSWQGCDCCEDGLGGDRYDAVAVPILNWTAIVGQH